MLGHLKNFLFASLAACMMAGPAFSQTPIFIDDFETGTAGVQIPANGTPWRVNTSGRPAFYQSAGNPFPGGNIYANLNDDISDGTNGTRLMSSNTADTGMLEQFIAGQVTTFSFDFYEPTDTGTPDQGGFGFGYSREDDLNSAEKNFRSVLFNGLLSPDTLVPGSGAAMNYQLEQVHTIFMLANDSANPVANYRGGQTLDPAQADIWISLNGTDPVFVFSVNKVNPTTAPQGVGFRTFSADVEELRIDNVLLKAGATFDRSNFVVCAMGDVNCDTVIDLENDFDAILMNFRRTVSSRSMGDLNGDGVVSFPDFVEWKSAFTAGGGSLEGISFDFVSAPEPSSIILAAITMFGLTCCRRCSGR
jgi:hypothetical protein